MILKGFFKNILFRVVLITITCLGLVYFASRLNEELYLTLIGLIALLLLQIYLLVRYVNEINNNLGYLLESITDENFSFNFRNIEKNGVSDEFQKSLDHVKSLLQDSKIQYLKRDVFLENIITHIGIGLFLLNENGEIELLNPAAKSLLKVEKLRSVNDFEKISEGLSTLINNIMPSKPMDVKINIENEILHLLFKVSVFKIDKKVYRLISLQNIKDELDRNELSSWLKLIKVFTHEIMNAVTPIASLAASLQKQIRNGPGKAQKTSTINEDVAMRTLDGLEIIEDTSKGLLSFVSKHRDLTALSQSQISEVDVSGLFDKIALLLKEEMATQKIELKVFVDPQKFSIVMDKTLIELAIINLIKNAITALENTKSKQIYLKAYFDHIDRPVIEIKDNGSGIKPQFLEDIFTPFFSTKEGGTGIGLSLCRQIMKVHNGKILVNSKVNVGTTFKMIF